MLKNLLKVVCLLVAAAVGVASAPLLFSHSAQRSTVYLLSGTVTVTASGEITNKCDYTYDKMGKCLSCREQQFANKAESSKSEDQIHSTVFHYDENGRIVQYEDSLNGGKPYSAYTLSYYKDGSLKEVSSNSADGEVLFHARFDENGNLLESSNSNGQTTTFTYNSRGERIAEDSTGEDPRNVFRVSNVYDEQGRLIESDTYNSLGDLHEKELTTYDENGGRSYRSFVYTEGEETPVFEFDYDKNDNLTLYKRIDNGMILEWYTAEYDEENNQTLKIYYLDGGKEVGRVIRDYNATLRTETYTYYPAQSNVDPHLVESITYDESGNEIVRRGNNSYSGFFHYQYAYDENGNLSQLASINEDGAVTSIRSYAYTTLLLTDKQKETAALYGREFSYKDLLPD